MATSQFSKPGVLVGCRDVVFAKLLTDTNDGTTYATEIKGAPGVVEIALTAQNTEANLGADDIALYEVVEAFDGYEVSMTMAALGEDLTAFLLGATVGADGVVVESSLDDAPYVACGFKATRSDGSDDYIWMYKGRFSHSDANFHTREQGTVNWQTPALKGMFTPRQSDRLIKATLNTKNEAAATVKDTFFNTVYAPAKA